MHPRINKWLDLADRVGWTAVYSLAGAGLTILSGATLGWRAALTFAGTQVALAVCKVIIGQNTGSDDNGSLIGTSVIEPPPISEG